MFNKIVDVVTTAFVVTGIGIALRPDAPTAAVLSALTSGIAKMQSAAFGPVA